MSAPSVVLATFHHRHEAELARGYLEDAGIASALTVDDGGGAFGVPLTFSAGSFASVRVRPEDAERAREVLERAGILEEGEDVEGEGGRG